MSYYVHRNGQTLGPYTSQNVVDMLRAHQLAVEDLATESGVDDWQPLGNIVDPALLKPPETAPIRGGAVELEARTKRGGRVWKALGFLAIVIGIFMLMAGSQERSAALGVTGTMLVFGGFVMFIVGRFQD